MIQELKSPVVSTMINPRHLSRLYEDAEKYRCKEDVNKFLRFLQEYTDFASAEKPSDSTVSYLYSWSKSLLNRYLAQTKPDEEEELLVYNQLKELRDKHFRSKAIERLDKVLGIEKLIGTVHRESPTVIPQLFHTPGVYGINVAMDVFNYLAEKNPTLEIEKQKMSAITKKLRKGNTIKHKKNKRQKATGNTSLTGIRI